MISVHPFGSNHKNNGTCVLCRRCCGGPTGDGDTQDGGVVTWGVCAELRVINSARSILAHVFEHLKLV